MDDNLNLELAEQLTKDFLDCIHSRLGDECDAATFVTSLGYAFSLIIHGWAKTVDADPNKAVSVFNDITSGFVSLVGTKVSISDDIAALLANQAKEQAATSN